MMLMEFFEQVYRQLRLIQATAGTIQQYQVAIGSFDRFLGRPATLNDLREEVVTAFMGAILKDGNSPVTANGKANYLKTLARFAKRKGKITDDLSDVQKLRAPRRLPTAWTLAEMEKLIHGCRQTEGRICGVPAPAWWVAFVLTAYDTGLRRRALLAMRFADLDFDQGILHVPAENMKTLVAQSFKLHPQTIEALLASVPPDRELVFPMHFQIDTFNHRFKQVLMRAGLPFTRRDMAHKLRRTCASHIAAKMGVALAVKQLGHLDPSCINRYVDPTFTASHDLVNALPRPLWENPREVIVTRAEGPVYHLGKPLKIVLPGDGLGHAGAIERITKANVITPADLREAIEQMGVSVVTFCEEGRLNAQNVYKILRGKQAISPTYGRRLRHALGIGPAPSDSERRAQLRRELMKKVDATSGSEMLRVDPMNLVPRFVREFLAGYSESHQKQVAARLRTCLMIDGATCVRDLSPLATIVKICERERAGLLARQAEKIGRQGAKMCRISLRLFLRWLVHVHGVDQFAGALARMDRRFTLAAKRGEVASAA